MEFNVNFKSYTQDEYNELIKNLIKCNTGINKSNGNWNSSEYAIVSYLKGVFDFSLSDDIEVLTNSSHTFIIAFIKWTRSQKLIYSLVMNIQLSNDVVTCTDDLINFKLNQQSLSRSAVIEPHLKNHIKFDGLNITVINPTPVKNYVVTIESEGPIGIWKSGRVNWESGKFEGDYVDCLEYLYDNRDNKELCHQYALVKDQSTKSMQILEYSKSIKIDRSKFTIICIGSINKINEKLNEIISKYNDNPYFVWKKNSIAYQICLDYNPEVEFKGSLKECNDYIYDKVKSIPIHREFAVHRGQNEFPHIEIYDNDDVDAEFHGTIQECNTYIADWCKLNVNIIKMLAHG